MLDAINTFVSGMGVYSLEWDMIAMWGVAILLLYMGVAKQFEPLLLVPIAFGALIANIPDNGTLVTKVCRQIVSIDNQTGNLDSKSLNDVGYIRVGLVPIKHTAQEEQAAIAAASGEDDAGFGAEESAAEEKQEEANRKRATKELNTALHEPAVISPVVENGKVLAGQYDMKGQASQEYMVTTMHGGLFDIIGQGIKMELFPPIIFLGVGALTDFGPLLAAPRTLLLGAAAQMGVAATFFMALFFGFSQKEAASIGIIGGADGPTSIFLTMKLAPALLGSVAVAAYTYMALVPLIQPPIMKLLTTPKERVMRMKSLRMVSKGEKLFFAVLVTVVTILLIPDASPLIGMLMLGNFLRECKVTERLVLSAQNEIINIVTIFLGTSVGLTMQANRFLQVETMLIITLGIVAFVVATAGGVLTAKVMNLIWRKDKINPLIGSAGVSAVPMAARVSHVVGQKFDPSNYLLMHAMGPNVAGVIGTAVIAGYYIATLAR